MIVVVGGSARNVGKTTVICEIISATPEAQWTALKLTSHSHQATPKGDTGRYLAAGAMKVELYEEGRQPDCFEANVIVESNSILDRLAPDLFVFVEGEAVWKPSALKHAAKADIVVQAHASPELIDRIRRAVTGLR